jgi:hypothetical protein
MTKSFFGSTRFSFFLSIALILIYVLFLCLTESNDYWMPFALLMCVVQFHTKVKVSMLFPLLACLTLTEYYFLIGEKRVYLCEILFYPLVLNFLIIYRKNFPKVCLYLLLLAILITVFQGINLVINSDFTASFFRVRTLAFPLAIIGIVVCLIRTKSDLKKIVNLILVISVISSLLVYLQFLTGKFYVLQTESFLNSEERFFLSSYLESTEDSIFFQLLHLNIKGPIPPVGLNYYKFGFSERILVPLAICSAMGFFSKKRSEKFFYWILFLLQFMATLLTGSRSILMTAILIVLLLFLFYRQKLKWRFVEVLLIAIFIIIYFIAPLLSVIGSEELGTLASRITYLDEFFKYISANPSVLIAGTNADDFIKFSNAGQPPHHFFAFGIIADGTIITILLFASIYLVLKKILRFKPLDKEVLAICYGIWASIFAFIFIYGQTSYVTWSIPHNVYFYFMIGILIAGYRLSKPQEIQQIA